MGGGADQARVELNGNPVQSGGPNRERLYRAGFSPPRAGGGRADRVRVELNGNPVQSGGLNRERLYQVGFGPPRADRMGGRTEMLV